MVKVFLYGICLILVSLKVITGLDISWWLALAPLLLILAWWAIRWIAGWSFILGFVCLLAAAQADRNRRYHQPYNFPDKES